MAQLQTIRNYTIMHGCVCLCYTHNKSVPLYEMTQTDIYHDMRKRFGTVHE